MPRRGHCSIDIEYIEQYHSIMRYRLPRTTGLSRKRNRTVLNKIRNNVSRPDRQEREGTHKYREMCLN